MEVGLFPVACSHSEIVARRVKCICKIMIFMVQMACWNKEEKQTAALQMQSEAVAPLTGTSPSQYQICFIFIPPPPQSQWCHPAGVITALYIYKIIHAKSKDKMMDDYMLGSSAPARLRDSLNPCRNSTLTYTCKWRKERACFRPTSDEDFSIFIFIQGWILWVLEHWEINMRFQCSLASVDAANINTLIHIK